jgi:hypothetical protein
MIHRWFQALFVVGLLGLALGSRAQHVTPLHTFFQRNYDSTIIYQIGLREQFGPAYQVLAQHRGQFYFFTYQSPYRHARGRYFPGNLVRHFTRQESAFRAAEPDTNRYLLPGTVLPDTLRRYWQRLRPGQLWALKGDGPGWPAARTCVIDDGDHNIFYLIDRRGIRSAAFYAPAYWEECIGKDPNRQQALSIIKVFNAISRANRQRQW